MYQTPFERQFSRTKLKLELVLIHVVVLFPSSERPLSMKKFQLSEMNFQKPQNISSWPSLQQFRERLFQGL